MATINNPTAGISPYQGVAPADPILLRAGADGATVLAATTTTTTTTTDANSTAIINGQEALNQVITTSRTGVFQGANVTINLEEQQFSTTNQVTSTTNYASGNSGAIQYNNGTGGFSSDSFFTYDNSNVITPGIRTDGYFYSNGAAFLGGGNAAIGNFVFTGDTMTTSNPTLYITANGDSNSSVTSIKNVSNAGNSDILLNRAQVAITSGTSNTWTFAATGSTIFPTLTTQRGDNPSGTISGQTLLFGNSLQEAIISTPDGTVGNEYSQRLVINPGAGNNFGEGGDIYLWAGRGGDGSGSGGDIKIRGGQGGDYTQGGAGGDGGYIRIEAGDAPLPSSNPGGIAGFIEMTAGIGGENRQGGYIHITAGQGGNTGPGIGGGDANIQGGYGRDAGRGGNVNLIGGIAQSGAASYGNVNIIAGTNTWTFDNQGNLNSSANIITTGNVTANAISANEFTAPSNVTILSNNNFWSFVNDGNTVFPSGAVFTGQDLTASANSYIELAGNTGNTYVGLDNSNVFIQTDWNGAQYQWDFQPNGNATFPGNLALTGNITAGNLDAVNLVINSITSDDSTFVTIEDGVNINGEISATGNITGNYFIGNGSQLTGILANTGNVTFSGEIVIGTGTSNLISGLYLAPSSSSANANMYLRVRGNIVDEPTHIHFDTGNNAYYNQFIGDDNKYIQLANTGNIVINSNDVAGNSAQWTFGADGNLNLPQGGNITEGAIPAYTSLTGNTIVLTPAGGTSADQQLVIYPTVNPGADANHLHLTSGNLYNTELFLGDDNLYVKLANTGNIVVNSNDNAGNTAQWTFGTDSALTLPASSGQIGRSGYPNGIDLYNNNGGTGYVRMNYADESLISADSGGAHVQTTGGTWDFGSDGNLTFPTGNLVITPDAAASSNAAVISSADYNLITLSTGANGGTSSLWVEDYANVGTSNIAAVYANPVPGSGNVRIAVGANGGGGPNLWDFEPNGNLTAPGNIITTGNITGAYLFGNGSQLTDVGAASVPGQNILPTIQTITVSGTSGVGNAGGGGSAFANVTVSNVTPVTEYGVIITSGTSSQKYATGALGSIPGTVQLTFSTGLNSTPFTVYAYVTSNAGTYYSNAATGTSGICLLAGTQIALSDGTHKAIEDITYTDKLLSWDFDRGCYAETTALWIKRSETGSQYNLLTFSDGTTLRTFDQHRIFNKQAGAFTYPMTDATPIGTVTVNEHGQEITLTNKQVIKDTIEYYNVITDYHMNLFSDTVLTSCRFNNIYPITDMKFAKDGRTLRTRAEFENVPDRFFHGLRLAEQTTDIETIEWYVNRLLATEVSTQSELAV